MTGTRWLALRQPIVNLVIKAAYLTLTLGRAMQTLGEEYTDILPQTRKSRLPHMVGCGLGLS
jgi:peroxin-10